MNTIAKKGLKLTQENLAEMRATASVREATYMADKATKSFSAEDYEVKVIPGKYGDFRKVAIQIEGEATPFEFRVYGNKEIDADEKVTIQRYVTQREFTCSNGTVLPVGKAEWFAVQKL